MAFILLNIALASALAFFLADRLLWLMGRLSAPHWIGPYFCVLFAIFGFPFVFFFLASVLTGLTGGSPEGLGFAIGPITRDGLLGGLIGTAYAIYLHKRNRQP